MEYIENPERFTEETWFDEFELNGMRRSKKEIVRNLLLFVLNSLKYKNVMKTIKGRIFKTNKFDLSEVDFEYRDSFFTDEDIERENRYFTLINKLSKENDSRYEAAAKKLNGGGEEILHLNGQTFKFFVNKNGCGYSILDEETNSYSRLSWAHLSKKYAERIVTIKDSLAQCEAEAVFER